MTSEDPPMETTVSDRGMVAIPASLRRRLDIEAGDKIRWDVDEDGTLSVEVVRQRYGAFEDDDLKAAMGGDGPET
ncbi:AbrB/MazE/SpoVT family DNA-binding domain-containing protein [Halovivax gelatinilyticus]|uniref:AbrB/MazE/SpoVT family DNA-binding domain-containing protein n=1 Tax=Halovivax gelatinilyticus TaxID=2961597 RepID=UPI0020CA2B7C|nr:AbrB/MazE/SpoVT family DNA-binding domain-containing protein [Halovivax gelatinilyticus]